MKYTIRELETFSVIGQEVELTFDSQSERIIDDTKKSAELSRVVSYPCVPPVYRLFFRRRP